MYLEELTLRLAGPIARLDTPLRAAQVDYLKRAQRPDGGWAGREGQSDLYYTSFALRSLALLGELQGDLASRAAGFLRSRLSGEAAIVDFLSLVFSAATLKLMTGGDVFDACAPNWTKSVAARLESLRRADGGYAKTEAGQASSMYHSFLVVLCQQLLPAPTPHPKRLVDFVRTRRRDDAGFVEMIAMKRSGTNPTAAAIGLLRIFDALDQNTRQTTGEFLASMQTDEGGLLANTRIPIADLLSTFTGLVTLADLGETDRLDLPALREYVLSLQCAGGGFHGAAWDSAHDVEYTFYGLGALALVTPDDGTSRVNR